MVAKWLDAKAKQEIARTIGDAEKVTSAEVRVHVVPKVRRSVQEDAWDVFWRSGMHLTRERNGVLIYVARKSHEFAIIGDKGIHEKVGDTFWNAVRDRMEEHFKKNEFKEAFLAGIRLAGEALSRYFPARHDDKNELSNEVTETR